MAEQMSDVLYNKVLDLNRRRRGDWTSSLAALPSTTAVFGSNPGMAQANAQSFFPAYAKSQQPQPSKLDIAAEKAKIIKEIGRLEGDQREGEMKTLGEMFKESKGQLGEVIKLAGAAYGHKVSGIAQLSSNANTTSANIGKTLSDAMMQVAGSTNIVNKGGVSQGIELVRAAMNSVSLDASGSADASVTEQLRDLISNMVNQGEMAEAAAIMSMGDAIALENGHDSFRSFLETDAASQPGGPSDQILAFTGNPEMVSAIHENSKQAMLTVQADMAQRDAKILKGIPGMEHLGDFIENTYAQISGLENPADRQKAFMSALDSLPSNADPKSIEAFADLLGQLDTDQQLPAGNLAEARMRLFEDESFTSWMSANGFTDQKMALKEMRRLAQAKVEENRAHDRELMARRRQSGVGPDTGTVPPPSQAAALVNGQPSTASQPDAGGEDDVAKLVKGDDGQWYLVQEDGTLRPATEEDFDIVEAELLKAESGQAQKATMDAMVLPSSRFSQFKKAAAPAPAPGAAPPATPGATMQSAVTDDRATSPEKYVQAKPSVRTVTQKGAFAVSHPVDTLADAGKLAKDGIVELLRKKKKPGLEDSLAPDTEIP